MYNMRFLEYYTVLLPHSMVHCEDLWDNGTVEHKAKGYFLIETSQKANQRMNRQIFGVLDEVKIIVHSGNCCTRG